MRIKNRWVPFIFLTLGCLLLSQLGHSMTGDWWVNCSSFVSNTSTGIYIQNTVPGDVLGEIFVSTRSATPAWLNIYDASQSVTSTLIDTIDLSTGATSPQGFALTHQNFYHVRLSSGITIQKTDSTSRATLFWHATRGKCN